MNSLWLLEIIRAQIRWKTRCAGVGDVCFATLSAVLACLLLLPASARAQTQGSDVETPPVTIQLAAPPSTSTAPPLTLTLVDAISRAQKNSPDFLSATEQAKLAQHNQVQARAAMLPSISGRVDYQNTEGNKVSPVGRFVTNDGIHVYRAWVVAKEDMPPGFFFRAGPRAAAYESAIAAAQRDIALRGLRVTVTHNYYALLIAQRAYSNAQQNLASAQHFLQISRSLEQGGEVAHADVIRFQLQQSQAERDLQEAQLALSNAQLNLAILLFPNFNENFTVVDDLDTPPPLPSFPQAANMAKVRNPVLQSAMAAYHESGINVSVARAAFLPSFTVEFDYGIEANHFALESVNTTSPCVSVVPRICTVEENLGYNVTAGLTVPVWDWGANWSKLHAAEDQRQLARVNLNYAQRQVLASLYADYNQAAVAWNELASLRQSADLAARNLQLVTMQYQAGESQVPQVLDAQTSMQQARDAYAAGAARYRDALATLQTLTGSF